jgi:hypothetical protein
MHWNGNEWVADTPPAAPRTSRVKRVAAATLEASMITALTFGLIAGTAFAGKGGGGAPGGGGRCTAAAPLVRVENTWAWASWGSFGLPGQQLQFQVSVTNNDAGCGRSTFTVGLSAPEGFSVLLPTNTVSLRSGRVGYLSGWVTSPAGSADGDYAIVATATRSTSDVAVASGSFTSYYKVYSSDTTGPTLYWATPGDGATIASGSYNVAVWARDDKAVKTVKVFVDGVLASTMDCDGVTYSCTANYGWSATSGQHEATFRSSDWMGNVSELTSTFTVN